ncbi:hypothetical protein Pint_21975 [Pistacia integerrima]|uniref:Uncharacterized protein n=1 Tax=Pistacia integerrima TaxID=434235 RepID=A0ACC0YJZ3_9ROSI|nr:hypothetical protein Pint_21975 [Pistacia integerrima]
MNMMMEGEGYSSRKKRGVPNYDYGRGVWSLGAIERGLLGDGGERRGQMVSGFLWDGEGKQLLERREEEREKEKTRRRRRGRIWWREGKEEKKKKKKRKNW